MKQQRSLCPKFFLAAALALPAFASAQVAAPEPAAPPADALPGHFAEERHSSTSEVIAVDAATRMITLKEEGGEPQTYEVNKEVRNLDQVKPGDRVKVDYFSTTSIKVLPPGELVNDDVEALERSKPGEKPGGVAARQRTETVLISSIFPGSKEFMTRNAKNQLRTWKVKDPKELEQLKSGDRIQLTYTSALAISVTPAPKSTTTTAPTAAPAKPAEPPAAAPAPTPAQP